MRVQNDPWHAGLGVVIGRQLLVVALLTLLAVRFLVDPSARAPAPAGTPPETDLASCRVTYVIDGDTVTLTCPNARIRARLVGFDAPEVASPACEAERSAGEAATKALERAIAAADTIAFEKQGWDRYGRALIRMFLDGQDVAEIMIAAGLAAPGGWAQERDWCA